MSELLKGNFKVKREVVHTDATDEKEQFNAEYRKKALESIGGSMVFIERKMLFWDGDKSNDKK